jgi:triacylglycerol lipase
LAAEPKSEPRFSRLKSWRCGALAALAVCLAIALAGAAGAQQPGPQLTVSKGKLAAALHCQGKIAGAAKEPVLLSTGTGATGGELYALLKPALDRYSHPVCYIDYPSFTTADVQISVQYLVFATRRISRLADRPIAIYGISQGALLPRIALDYWPGLVAKVTDVIAAAGPQHGSTASVGTPCSRSNPCAPAIWQQIAGSNILRALSHQLDQSPGTTGWTTVRSLNDEVVQPQSGPHPASVLRGASNILIQSVCPGRQRNHVGTSADSVTFAALVDAVAHRGPAKAARFPANVCAKQYAPGIDDQGADAGIAAYYGVLADRIFNRVPKVPAEPRVRAWAKRVPPVGY